MMYSIPHGQSLPTSVLYEKARQAAAKSSSSGQRKGSNISQRRPWTTEEEQALMAGLDAVKGPHWSQILALYGPGGTISEALRDRTQVQLKDKARNLKLFFLKSHIEVPYYLGFVTGELKSRAPSHVHEEGGETTPERGTVRPDGVGSDSGIATPSSEHPAPSIEPPGAAANHQMRPTDGTYASPYAVLRPPRPPAPSPPPVHPGVHKFQATLTPSSATENENDNIDPAIKQASQPSPATTASTKDLATSAAEAAQKSIALLNSAGPTGYRVPLPNGLGGASRAREGSGEQQAPRAGTNGASSAEDHAGPERQLQLEARGGFSAPAGPSGEGGRRGSEQAARLRTGEGAGLT